MSNVAFIISQTRSGSTMLQRMLGAHPNCLTSTGEPYLMLALLQGFRGECIDDTARWAKDASARFMQEFNSEPVFGYAIRGAANEIYGDALEKASFLCNAFDKPQKTRFIDKTPRYFLILKDLMRMYQPEDFVFLVRNPLDVLASTLTFDKVSHWHDLASVVDKFNEDHYSIRVNKMADILYGPQQIAKAMRRWKDRACVVRYEDLVADPTTQLMRVCGYLGLPFDVKMLTYDNGTAKYADDNSMVKHDKPVTNYVNNWRERMDPTQAKTYLEALGTDVLMTFGYPELIEEFNL